MSAPLTVPRRVLRLARAVATVPPARLWARLVHEASRRGEAALPHAWRERLAGVHRPPPARRPGYLTGLVRPVGPGQALPELVVEVLGHPHSLRHPIDWEPAGKGRLWGFTLHYFDWAVAAVAEAERPGLVARAVFAAMRSWVESVPYGRFDAWHPYPTAKRLVAWTYLLGTFPELETPEVARSHWLQVRFLARNLERHAGGNHLLQDLCALVVAGLRYQGGEADAVVERALRDLARETPRQVTADGCHHELSAAYHLQTVVMLAEAAACLAAAGCAPPGWLLEALEAMTGFARRMRLPDGSYPLWSDSARDSVASLDVVVAFAEAALATGRAAGGGPNVADGDEAAGGGRETVGSYLPSSGADGSAGEGRSQHLPYPYAGLIASAMAVADRRPVGGGPFAQFRPLRQASGYHVLRGDGVVAVFDGAHTGARDLPGHGHADCLNVDVYTDAGPLLVESGTSTYDPGAERDRERSTAAHNTVEVGGSDQSEMWGSFRVVDPARAFDRVAGETGGWRWATAAHDGYQRGMGVTHRRWVGVQGATVVVLDELELTEGAPPVPFRLCYHLAPGVEACEAGDEVFTLRARRGTVRLGFAGLTRDDVVTATPAVAGASYYAERFGHRQPRGLLEVAGTLSAGRRYLATVVSPQAVPAELRRARGVVELALGRPLAVTWRDWPGPLVPVDGRAPGRGAEGAHGAEART